MAARLPSDGTAATAAAGLGRAGFVMPLLEAQAQFLLQPDLFPEASDVASDHLQRREALPVQAVADLLQREAELPQRDDLLAAYGDG